MAVTQTVLVAFLATIAGVLIVGVGGDLIRPMQSRSEQYLSTADQEKGNIREQVAPALSPTEQAARAGSGLRRDLRQVPTGATQTAEAPTGPSY